MSSKLLVRCSYCKHLKRESDCCYSKEEGYVCFECLKELNNLQTTMERFI
jgi:DNA-directed RNA polymerase subunit RPC12/RpoP